MQGQESIEEFVNSLTGEKSSAPVVADMMRKAYEGRLSEFRTKSLGLKLDQVDSIATMWLGEAWENILSMDPESSELRVVVSRAQGVNDFVNWIHSQAEEVDNFDRLSNNVNNGRSK